jgi:hypothetical protein
MSAPDTIRKALEDNPDLRIVLEIASRARELEAKEPPRELVTTTGVVTIPANQQVPV